jgi:ribosomal-protein-alanine N-acetyltransferase
VYLRALCGLDLLCALCEFFAVFAVKGFGAKTLRKIEYPSPVPVRPAKPTDIPTLLALAQASPTASHWSQAQYDDIFAGTPRTILVVEDASTIQAFLVAQTLGPDWEIENIVVAASEQRRGLGTLLLEALLERAQRAQAAILFLEVRESNRAARAFYEHHGFRESGRRRNYYGNPLEDAVLYRLELR